LIRARAYSIKIVYNSNSDGDLFANLGHSCDSHKKQCIFVSLSVPKDNIGDGKLTSCRKLKQTHALRLAFHRRMRIAVQCRFDRTMPQ